MPTLAPPATHFHVDLPAGLELADDFQRFVVGAIVAWQATPDYTADAPGPDAWVPLAWVYLREVIGDRNVRPTLDALLEAGVIETDGEFWWCAAPGARGRGKALCYCLGARWRRAPTERVELRHPQLRANLTQRREEQRAAVTDPVHLGLRAWADRVTIDPGAPVGASVILDRIRGGLSYFVADAFAGRVHTVGTVVPREYREFVRLDGRADLVGVDVGACQPLLLTVQLTRWDEEARPSPPRLYQGGVNNSRVSKSSTEQGVQTGTGTEPGGVQIVSQNDDAGLSDMQEACAEGRLYEALCAETGYDRTEQKKKFLAVLYGHPCNWGTRTGGAVERLWPGVLGRIAARFDQDEPNALARAVQRLEVEVMIDTAAARFLRAYPDVPLLTVHDCLVVPASHAAAAEEVVRAAWVDRCGIEPKLKREPWRD